MIDAKSIGGVVVTFHPDPEFEARLRAVISEVKNVIVVDNTAEPLTQARLATISGILGAELICNAENRGLGAALNQGFAHLANRGLQAAAAFDQDSTPVPGFIRALVAVADTHATWAAVGSSWHDEARPEIRSRHLRARPGMLGGFQRSEVAAESAEVTCVITSGTLFSLPLWRSLGGFDETLFVDLVDTDYCLRARAAGHAIVVAATARLAHRRGAKQPVRFFGRTWWPAFMSPIRLRCLFRNRIHLARRHARRESHWLLFELIYAVKILTEIVLLEDAKGAKLAACLRGTWDGLIGTRGPVRS